MKFKSNADIADPLRSRLADALAVLAELDAEAAALRAALGKLSAAEAAVVPASAAIAELDAEDAAATAAWARNPDAPTPKPDAARRAKLLAEANAARLTGDSARRASVTIGAELAAVESRRPALDATVSAAIAEILAQEIERDAAEMAERIKAALRKAEGRLRPRPGARPRRGDA